MDDKAKDMVVWDGARGEKNYLKIVIFNIRRGARSLGVWSVWESSLGQ